MRRPQAPEMARVPLDALVLDIHQLGLGPAAGFLAGPKQTMNATQKINL